MFVWLLQSDLNYKQGMSEIGSSKSQSAVRLRKPERGQVAMLIQCPDDLIGSSHPVRMVMAVVERLDLSRFHEPIKARAGQAGREATDPQLLVALWLYVCIRGIGSARELARRSEDSAAFRWLCGGVSVNHRLLSEFRTNHCEGLDALFTQVIASLVDKGIVHVSRVSQDGVRVRVGAGASSFRRQQRLEQLLQESRQHVQQLRNQVDSQEHAALSARQRAARERAAVEKLERLEQAIAQLPELKQKQAEAARRAGCGKRGKQIRNRQPRVSTTDAQARVMKMPNGGFNPAVNVQLAADTGSRAILGVEVSNEGSDNAGLSEPMRRQVELRTGGKVQQQLIDGGYMRTEDIEQAHQAGVELFVPPKPARHAIKAMNWNPNAETPKRCWPGNGVWPAKRENRSTSNGPPPAKQLTETFELIAA
jgi:transposase